MVHPHKYFNITFPVYLHYISLPAGSLVIALLLPFPPFSPPMVRNETLILVFNTQAAEETFFQYIINEYHAQTILIRRSLPKAKVFSTNTTNAAFESPMVPPLRMLRMVRQ